MVLNCGNKTMQRAPDDRCELSQCLQSEVDAPAIFPNGSEGRRKGTMLRSNMTNHTTLMFDIGDLERDRQS